MKAKRDTEQLIQNTLLDMMESKSFFSIKVVDLTEKAGISRGLFYVYFDSIYDVLQKIEDDYIDGLPGEQRVLNGVRDREGEDVSGRGEFKKKSYQFAQDNMRVYRLLSGPNGDPSFYHKLKNRVIRITQEAVGEGATKKDDNYMKLAAAFLAGGNVAIFDWWAHNSCGVDAKGFSDIAENLYTDIFNCVMKRM